MPTYEYMCTACGERTDAVQKFTDDPLTECPNCGGALRKLFSSVGIVFKGSGFYRNDSRDRAKVGAGSSSSDNSSSSDSSGTAADSSPATASTGAAAAAPSSGSESTSTSATTPATPSTTSAGKPAAPKSAVNGSKPKSGGSKPAASS